MYAVLDILRVRAFTYCLDQVGLNILHYKVTALVGTPPTPQQLADRISTVAAARYKAIMSSDAEYVGVQIGTVVAGGALADVAQSTIGAGLGTTLQFVLPRQVTGLITLRTAVPGRKGRGRIYIPFPPQTDEDHNGVPAGNYPADLNAWMTQMQAITWTSGANTAGIDMAVYHRSTNTADLVTGYVSRNKFATQRRRGSYGKRNDRPLV